jgi:hypothetical protein
MFSKYLPPPSNKKEMHIPGYNFCGPGTDVEGRIMRGDNGVNELDMACRKHDVDYLANQGNPEMLKDSDKMLIEAANRVISRIEESKGFASKVVSFLSAKGLPLGFFGEKVSEIIDNGGVSEKFAANLIKNVFEKKGNLENALGYIGFKDFPSVFARQISSYDDNKAKEIGEKLYKMID